MKACRYLKVLGWQGHLSRSQEKQFDEKYIDKKELIKLLDKYKNVILTQDKCNKLIRSLIRKLKY